VERMVSDAQSHASEDKLRREVIESRNQTDSLGYQLERALKDFGDKVPLNEKARSEQLVQEARAAVKDESVGKERYQQLISDLQQAIQMVSSSSYRQAGAGPADAEHAGAAGGGRERPSGGDDVIDAEFTER
jgi:molecular chaperone DnaK